MQFTIFVIILLMQSNEKCLFYICYLWWQIFPHLIYTATTVSYQPNSIFLYSIFFLLEPKIIYPYVSQLLCWQFFSLTWLTENLRSTVNLLCSNSFHRLSIHKMTLLTRSQSYITFFFFPIFAYKLKCLLDIKKSMVIKPSLTAKMENFFFCEEKKVFLGLYNGLVNINKNIILLLKNTFSLFVWWKSAPPSAT